MNSKRLFLALGALALFVAVVAINAYDVTPLTMLAAIGGHPHIQDMAMAAVPAAASIEDLSKNVDKFMNAFEEFKNTNDENLKKRDVLLDDKLDKINKTLDKFEPLNQHLTTREASQKAMQEQMDQVEKILNRPRPGKEGQEEDAEYNAAFEHCMRKSPESREAAHTDLMNKRRAALVKGDDAGAGYLLAPPDVNREIIKDIIEMSPMRSLATVRMIGGDSLKQPKRMATAGAATRVGEVQQRPNTGEPAYGMLTFNAPELFARAEISIQMLEDTDYDLIGELRGEFVDQFAIKENAEFVGGAGASNQAEGFLTNSDVAEVVSGSASTLIGDGLINLWSSLKTGYSSRAVFTLNRKTIAEVRKLKTADNQYIWMPGLAGSVPNTILGGNYVEFPDMPDIAAGTYPIAYGDFRRAYLIVDRVSLSFQPDYNTGADRGTVVFRARKRVGGGVRQPEALKKLKIAA